MSKQQFQTEVNQLLQLIVHSLYSHPEIFLRELISNSSDALDKLRHSTLVDDKYKALVGNSIDSPRIDLELDEEKKILTISDTGIGMNEEDLIAHLGTIARSGTKNFLAQLSGDARKDSNLIGQFGVGFYSVFMVADKVEVFSRKAGEDKTFKWTSDGKTGFDIEEATGNDVRSTAGTTVVIHFNEEGAQYANSWRLQEIVKKYSNHFVSGSCFEQISLSDRLPARRVRRAAYPSVSGRSLQKRLVMTPKAKSLLIEIREPFVTEWICAKAAHFDRGVRHQERISHLGPYRQGRLGAGIPPSMR